MATLTRNSWRGQNPVNHRAVFENGTFAFAHADSTDVEIAFDAGEYRYALKLSREQWADLISRIGDVGNV